MNGLVASMHIGKLQGHVIAIINSVNTLMEGESWNKKGQELYGLNHLSFGGSELESVLPRRINRKRD